MIQELLGGAGIIGEDRKFSINSALESSPSPAPSPSSSTITATAAAASASVPASSSASAENQNLRCPRCNSSNTKFCYYNNYNLTQPRHFCKTCRRYWTKGGALRNVPIGGGCRKNKNVSVTSAAKSSPGRLKNISAEIGKAGGLVGGFDQVLPSNPALWASPQNSQFLALLRATQNQNPNPNANPISVKEETAMIGSHLSSNSMGRTLGLDLFNQDPGSFFWRNNQHQAQQLQQQQNHHHHHHHHHQHHQQQSGFILGEVQNTQEIYQRLRSTPYYYNPDHSPVVLLSNTGSSSSSTILESAPASATELGYWNPALPWSDLPTSNGAYP